MDRHFAYICSEMKKGGNKKVSEEKKKRKKVIHVDELIVKADKVVFVNDRDAERRPRDPWGVFFPRREERAAQNVEEETENTENQEEESSQEDRRRGWNWI